VALLLKYFKLYFFGSTTVRLTKQKCEEFFENKDNFTLTPDRLRINSVKPSGDIRDEAAEEDWIAELDRDMAALKARYRRKLEEQALYCPLGGVDKIR
jgi:hypothetical protein